MTTIEKRERERENENSVDNCDLLTKLVIDYREKALMDTLNQKKIRFQSKNLEVADIEIWHNGRLIFLIERKTVADYLNSISTHRLKNQLARMRTLSNTSGARVIVLLEGSLFPQFGSCLTEIPLHIYNSLLNRMLAEDIPVIRAETIGETVTWISKIMDKIGDFITQVGNPSGEPMHYLETIKVKKSENVDENNCYLLQLRQIPGVSQQGALAIREHHSSFPKLIDSYRALPTEKMRDNMLAKIVVGQRKLGPVLSKRIHQFVMRENPGSP